MKKLIFLFCLTMISSLLCAQQQDASSPLPENWDTLLDAYKGDKYYLPKESDVKLTSEIVISEIDGLISKELFLRSDQIQFRTIVLKNWQSLQSTVKQASAYSLLFANRYEPELKIGLTLYEKSALPSEFDEQSMLALCAGLRTHYRARDIEFLMPPGNVKASGYFASLLSSPTFKTDIQYRKPTDPRVILRNISFYFSTGDYAIVATMEGPSALVEINNETLESFLRNLSVYTPE